MLATNNKDNSGIIGVGPTNQRFDTTKFKLSYYFLDNEQQIGYFNHLPQEVYWFHTFTYLKLIDIIKLLFVSKSLNENSLNHLLMKYFDKLIIRLCGQFTFNTSLYLKYSLESLKRQFCISYVLAHLFFCKRSPNSNEGNTWL